MVLTSSNKAEAWASDAVLQTDTAEDAPVHALGENSSESVCTSALDHVDEGPWIEYDLEAHQHVIQFANLNASPSTIVKFCRTGAASAQLLILS